MMRGPGQTYKLISVISHNYAKQQSNRFAFLSELFIKEEKNKINCEKEEILRKYQGYIYLKINWPIK